jgi:hypothetical protein
VTAALRERGVCTGWGDGRLAARLAIPRGAGPVIVYATAALASG